MCGVTTTIDEYNVNAKLSAMRVVVVGHFLQRCAAMHGFQCNKL
jgi:hypothetical protein